MYQREAARRPPPPDERGADARAHRSCDQHAAPKQRAAIDETIGGNFRQRIAVTIFANAHDVLLAPAGNVSDLVGPDSMSLLPFQNVCCY